MRLLTLMPWLRPWEEVISSGPQSVSITKYVHERIYGALLLAKFGVSDDPLDSSWRMLKKNGSTVHTYLCKETLHGMGTRYSFCWCPGLHVRHCIMDLSRVLYASGGIIDSPAAEVYVFGGKEVAWDEFFTLVSRRIGHFEHDHIAMAAGLPSGVHLYYGPAIDPLSGAVRSYLALDYSFLTMDNGGRYAILQNLREIVGEFGGAGVKGT